MAPRLLLLVSSMSKQTKGFLGAAAAVCAAILLLYGPVLIQLVHHWWQDENYSHGFLVIPIAAYFVRERWQRLIEVTPQPRPVWGAAVLLCSTVLLFAGTLASEFFLTRVALIGTLAGTVLFLCGSRHLRLLAFPLCFLLLMIPLPTIAFNQIAFPLQLVASRFGESVLSLAGVPVLREGNVIVLSNTTLEVAEACSGIRSLVSLATMGILLSYFSDHRPGTRAFLVLWTIPVAIFANGLRVAGTGIAAHHFGRAAAEGFFHTFSGWLMFVVASGIVAATSRMLRESGAAGEARPHPVTQTH
jgi:exosortase